MGKAARHGAGTPHRRAGGGRLTFPGTRFPGFARMGPAAFACLR